MSQNSTGKSERPETDTSPHKKTRRGTDGEDEDASMAPEIFNAGNQQQSTNSATPATTPQSYLTTMSSGSTNIPAFLSEIQKDTLCVVDEQLLDADEEESLHLPSNGLLLDANAPIEYPVDSQTDLQTIGGVGQPFLQPLDIMPSTLFIQVQFTRRNLMYDARMMPG